MEKQNSWTRGLRQAYAAPGLSASDRAPMGQPNSLWICQEMFFLASWYSSPFTDSSSEHQKWWESFVWPFSYGNKASSQCCPSASPAYCKFHCCWIGYLEVTRLTGYLNFLKLCLSLKVANQIVYIPLHEPGLHTKNCTQCCYFCFSSPFPLDVGIAAFCGGSLRFIKHSKEAGWRHS